MSGLLIDPIFPLVWFFVVFHHQEGPLRSAKGLLLLLERVLVSGNEILLKGGFYRHSVAVYRNANLLYRGRGCER